MRNKSNSKNIQSADASAANSDNGSAGDTIGQNSTEALDDMIV